MNEDRILAALEAQSKANGDMFDLVRLMCERIRQLEEKIDALGLDYVVIGLVGAHGNFLSYDAIHSSALPEMLAADQNLRVVSGPMSGLGAEQLAEALQKRFCTDAVGTA